jgi:hypothetical protein
MSFLNYQLCNCFPLPKLPKNVNVILMTKIPFIKLLKKIKVKKLLKKYKLTKIYTKIIIKIKIKNWFSFLFFFFFFKKKKLFLKF